MIDQGNQPPKAGQSAHGDKPSRDDYEAALRRGVAAVHAWCLQEGVTPHPRLMEAFAVTLADLSRDRALSAEESPGLRRSYQKLDAVLAKVPADHRTELEAACKQVRQFIVSFPNAQSFAAAMRGWGWPGESRRA